MFINVFPFISDCVRLNHALAGLQSWWWHACNVSLHAACCALVTRACITIARLQRPFAALAALLFAVHPVHTEAVAGVVGRADVLACIFFLLSLLVYHRSTSSKKCVWLSVVLGALSMLAKETGVTVLLLNIVIDFYRCWPFVKRSFYSMKIEKKCAGLSVRTFKVLVSLALLVYLRLALLQGTWPSFSPQDNPAAFHPNFLVRLMTFSYLAFLNWWLLLCPWTLSHDWQMGSVPLITSGWDPRNLLTCAAFVALLLLCYRCCADIMNHRHTPAIVGVLLLVIPFLPASNLLLTVGFVIAERILYTPSIGSVIITAYGVQLLWYSKPGTKSLLVVSLAVLAASGVARTYRRNAEWQDRATLLRSDLVTLPQNAKLHYNFANFLRETEQQENAIKHYKEALRLWPTYSSAHNNIGTLLSGSENAEYHFLQAIKFNKHHANAHYNLGKLYKKIGQTNEAIKMLEKCILLSPKFVQAQLELISLTPEPEKRKMLLRLIELDPDNWEFNVLYGNWLKEKGLAGPASKFYLEATRLAFKKRNIKTLLRGDLISFRSTALMYRKLGQKSRTLQLLIRWQTWRRGWSNTAVVHLYLRDWSLKMELKGRVQIYSKAANPIKSTTCFDHSQLNIDVGQSKNKEDRKLKEYNFYNHDLKSKSVKQEDINKSKKTSDRACNIKKVKIEKHSLSISTQIKVTQNKSEIELKGKYFSMHRKQKNAKYKNVIPKHTAQHSELIKTF
ncbi:unnamed protein product [Parnassius apollo]|uniref:(apollo) hypothetical protein n=1 Tax=Parnassius apollo TaxID=110799 RepID=A0A8S3XGV8_PARAO|nr:unnamed protein product [Parnassius apollo]